MSKIIDWYEEENMIKINLHLSEHSQYFYNYTNLVSIKQFDKHFDSPTIQYLVFAVKNYNVHRELYKKENI